MTLLAQGGSVDKGLRFGMQMTPTVSWFSSDELDLVEPAGAIMGYSFGVIGDWFFSENYALASGFFYNAMGGKMNYKDGMTISTKNDGVVPLTGEATLRPNYLEVPIGFKFLTKEFWRVKVVGQCGYNQFFLMNAKLLHDGDYNKKDISSEFTALNASYHFGFGVEYSLGGAAYLTGSVLATMGMNDVTTSKGDNGVDPINKLNSINFKMGIIF